MVPARCDGDGRRGQDQDPKHQVRVLGSPVKHLARWAAKGPLERAGLARLTVAAVALHRLAPLLG